MCSGSPDTLVGTFSFLLSIGPIPLWICTPRDRGDGFVGNIAEVAGAFDDVVCGVLVRADQVLLVHRNASRVWAPNRWDAPGGHVEPGETDLEALSRELREELGIEVASEHVRYVARVSGDTYDLRVFAVDDWVGEPENRALEEHDALAWFTEPQLGDLSISDEELLPLFVDAIRQGSARNR